MNNTHEDSIDSIAYYFCNPEELNIYDTFLDAISRAKNNPDSKIYITEDLFIQFRDLMSKQNFLEKYKNETTSKFGISETVIHDNRDLFFKKKNYLISYDLLTKNINIVPVSIENIDKEENNMFKILEIYEEKKTREIEQKYDKQLEDLEFNDPVSVILRECEETIKEMLNVESFKLGVPARAEFTKETFEKRNKIIDIIYEEEKQLATQIKEINALLELAPNYEEKMKILNAYDIVDKKGKIK